MSFFIGRNIIKIFFLVGAGVAIPDFHILWRRGGWGVVELFKALPLGFPLGLFFLPSLHPKYIITGRSQIWINYLRNPFFAYPCNIMHACDLKLRTYNRLLWTYSITITSSTRSSISSSSTNAQSTPNSILVTASLWRKSAVHAGIGTWSAKGFQPELLENIRIALQKRNAAGLLHPLYARLWL